VKALRKYYDQIHQRIEAIRKISSTAEGCTRLAFSPEHERARRLVLEPYAGDRRYRVVRDPADNIFVTDRASGKGEGGLMVGSHLDTVIQGGAYDGVLGVVLGAGLLDYAREAGIRPRMPLHLVLFNDEEGVRFSSGLVGSRALAGRITARDLEARDREGHTVRDLLARTPGRGRGILGYRPPVVPDFYIEPHIEQGPRLVRAEAKIGIVSGIVGIKRFRLEAIGEANHAGTTPMDVRKDALRATALVLGRLPEVVGRDPVAVVTAGTIACEPNAHNVIPGRVVATIETRSPRLAYFGPATRRLEALVAAAQRSFGGRLRLVATRLSEPVPLARPVIAAMRRAARRLDVSHRELYSAAGHDAMNMARLCQAGMFFVPSAGGRSHRPDEFTAARDIELGFRFLLETARELGALP
jgi:hydantoinase/carbamoylase family amidase